MAIHRQGMKQESAVGTIIQARQHSHEAPHPRWDRIERAERFDPSLERQAQGISQRQAAQKLEVPRSTLPAWQAYQDSLAESPTVVAFFHSPPGLACLPRLVLGLPLVCPAVGACGMRLVCLLLQRTGLARFVGVASGTQQHVNRQVEEASGAYRREESARLARDMPAKNITLAKDETCTGGLCRVAMDPKSHSMRLEQAAQGRDPDPWQTRMEQALSGLNGRGMPSTSDEAPGVLASGAHSLGAPHSPDVCHVPQAVVNAVSGPMATKPRAASTAANEAQETLEQVQGPLQSAGGEPHKRGPGRPPQDPARLVQRAQAAEVARHAPQRLSAQREQVAQRLRALGHAYHCVDVARGVRRHGKRMAADLQEQMDPVRPVAQHAGLRQTGLERLEKAERVLPNMQATIACVSG
jgi:hypothetical protein